MSIDVFISHSSKDTNIADAICSTLEMNNISCWIAPRDIRPGSEWAEEINSAIENSRAMVLVFSENSNNSTQVVKELNLAINNRLIVLPFKIDDSTPTGSMKYYLSDTHWLDALNGNIKDEIEILKDILISVLSDSKDKWENAYNESMTQNKSQKRKKLSQKKILVLSAGIISALILTGAFYFNKQNKIWDCSVEKYSLEDNVIVGGQNSVKKGKISEIDSSFGLVHTVKIKNDSISSILSLDNEQEVNIKIKSDIKPSSITYLCGNNGPIGTISGDDVPYENDISSISIPAFPRSSDGYLAGDRYRIRIVVTYEEKISLKHYEVEKFYFDKNVKVQ